MEENQKVIKMSRSVFDKNFDQAKIMRELEERRNNDTLPINLPPIQEKEEQQIILPTNPTKEIISLPDSNLSQKNNSKNILPLLIFILLICRRNNNF